MIIPILSTPSCLGRVVREWEWEEPTDEITQILPLIYSRCVRNSVDFLMHFLLSCRDSYRRREPLYTTPQPMTPNDMCFKLYLCPRSCTRRRVRRYCSAKV